MLMYAKVQTAFGFKVMLFLSLRRSIDVARR